jgi:RNA polymerase sigma-70 factor (ECF subfamily)
MYQAMNVQEMSYIATSRAAPAAATVTEKPLAIRGYRDFTAKVMAFPAPAAALDLSPNDLLLRVGSVQDRQAFARLFDLFAPRLNAYMRKLGTEAGMAEELVQETMLLVWRKAASFDPAKASASTWIFTIARNKRIDALRKIHRPEVDLTDPALVGFGPASEAPTDSAVVSQNNQSLEKAIAALPPEQADLLRLAYFEDKAHGEIARTRQIPLGTVKSRLRLALEKLRRQLNSGDE